MRTSRILGVVCAGLFALSFGAQQAGATTPSSPAGVSQTGRNSNHTTQNASSEASTDQRNFNIPLSIFSVGGNSGDVHQFNGAGTWSSSSNDNSTQQFLVQHQSVSKDSGRGSGQDCGCTRGSDGEKHRGDHGKGDHGKGDHGKGDHGKGDHGKGDHRRGDKRDGDEHRGDHGKGDRHRGDKVQSNPCGCPGGVAQSGQNQNWTDQQATSDAKTSQINVNAPISVFSVGSNNGDVWQANDADTSASSSNRNSTEQGAGQGQWASRDGSNGCGPTSGDVSQSGSNRNSTDQQAWSRATTKQVNVNAPISLFSVGSNNGNVHQGNAADTHADSSNGNSTQQLLGQTQGVGLPLGL